MTRAAAVLTGAGISLGPPAGLPLGDVFHDRLLEGCFDAANRVTGGRLTTESLRQLAIGGRRNILGCVEDCLDEGTTAAVLDCMRVRVPTEEHLLCAVLAAHGTLQLTLNFDNGIELAYALLTGRAELTPPALADYGDALTRWRGVMPAAPPLRVIVTPDELAGPRYADRPLLVKLRGSIDVGTDGTVVPARPAMEDLESIRLDDGRLAALRVAATDGLLVTGHSGRDLDLFESLLGLLRPGRFDWVTPDLPEGVASRLRAVDASQPRAGTARQALRAQLPDLPDWPAVPVTGPGFADQFTTWWRGVPVNAAAEAYAWMLSEAGQHSDAILVLRTLTGTGLATRLGGVRVRLRLADALARRYGPGDLVEAGRLFGHTATSPRTPAALRAYAWTRWTECRIGPAPSAAGLLLGTACGAVAVATAYTGRGRRRVVVRCLSGVGRLGVRYVRAGLDRCVPMPGRRRVLLGVAVAAGLVLRYAWWLAGRAGTSTRQTDLELLRVRADLYRSMLRNTAPPADTLHRLTCIERAYTHRGNGTGVLRARLARSLADQIAGSAAPARTPTRSDPEIGLPTPNG